MQSIFRILAVLVVALIAGGSLALDSKKIASNDSAGAQSGYPAQTHDDSAMQAICKEILIDTDEGYGVTNHEARIVCDELR